MTTITADYRRSVALKSFVPLVQARHELYQGVLLLIMTTIMVMFYKHYLTLKEYLIACGILIGSFLLEESSIQSDYSDLEKPAGGKFEKPLPRTRYMLNIGLVALIMTAALSVAKHKK